MKDQEMLEKVRAEVSSAIQMLKERHPGADLAGGKRLLEEAAGAIEKNAWSQAIDLAQKAQLAAKPTTEYLLGRAKNLEARGSQAYKDEKYSEAMELWQTSLGEYGKVKEVALQRKEGEIVSAVEQTIASIEDDIKTAQRNKANADMHAVVGEANKAVDEAKKRFEAGEFDQAKVKFDYARELYLKGAKIAKDYGFDDKAMIEEAAAEMGVSIEACYLSKAEMMIEAASREKGGKREEAFSQVIGYLGSFSSSSQRYEELKRRAHQGLLRGRVEVGTKLMEDAEALLGKNEYYQAKEGYRKAQDHFENVRDYAVEHRLEREKSEVDKLIEDCTANIKVCTDSMLGREKIAKGSVRKVEDIRRGIRVQARDERAIEEKERKLEKVYASVRFLDSGGFGEVWLAQTKEGQTIALKILREPEKQQKAFFDELKVWQDLVHRNIVRLLSPKFSPMPLFEMEYVDGGDLKMLMDRDAPFSPERACRIAFDVARGLEYAHAKDVVHADLKPRNILLTTTEEAKITDWGLGRIATSSSKGIGYTPGYCAPEQVLRKPVDYKTDVYQLCVVLYQMLTGDNPFAHIAQTEMEQKVQELVPDRPSKNNARLEPLDNLILSCLEKDPRNRPGVREFREGLSKYMKLNYGVILEVTGGLRRKVDILCRYVMFSAKQKDYKECLGALRELSDNVRDREVKECTRSLLNDIEYRRKEGLIITDEVLDEIDKVLRKIEYGEA